ncbi:MAG: hypothetical protein M4579_006672 [Chaenotheca gracillima]|nr:MAG: hypothetical protein M4579_006672 [Chaenotheca gracillima]
MTSQSKSSKQSSRWGSFLQQAVAGVESRLDTILAEGETAPGSGVSADPVKRERASSRSSIGGPGSDDRRVENGGLSRTASNSRAQARLQERLAKAVVKNNNAALGIDSPATTSELPSRTASPASRIDSPRSSMDIRIADADTAEARGRSSMDVSAQEQSANSEATKAQGQGGEGLQVPNQAASSTRDPSMNSRPSMESHSSLPSRESWEGSRLASETQNAAGNSYGALEDVKSGEDQEPLIAQMRSDFEVAELRRQEETHTYLERIDALQSKLQYLTKEATEAARKSSSSAPPGSLDKKLAEKDEQISLLMEEGQKLSKTELKQMNTIKKLRTKQMEDERGILEVRRKQEKAERETAETRERFNRAEAAERRANERLKTLSKIESDLETLNAERDSNNELVRSLRAQLAQSASKADEAERKAQSVALEAEKKLVIELRDDLSSAKVEKELGEERLRAENRDLKERAERERERARITEVELRGEQSMLETRIEALRARVEEASTGATGDAQAKLLRQIETLQSQYAIASENWQGIESSLLTRVTSLEKERDDLSKREGDVRRKAREANLKSKRLEEELENSHRKFESLQQDLAERHEELDKLQRRAVEAENAMKIAREDFEKEKIALKADLGARIEQEKNKWREELAALTAQAPTSPYAFSPRTQSPTGFGSTRKMPAASAGDYLSTQTRRVNSRPVSSEYFLGGEGDRPVSRNRQVSGKPYPQPHHQSPNQRNLEALTSPPLPSRQDSASSLSHFASNGIPPQHAPPETPSIHTTATDQDSTFESHSSPHRTIADVISVSTVGAGPSVQLVERMSAAVRRLESEKASSKDELSRLSAQRDEARTEVVTLMREIEEKRAADERVAALEREITQMNQRYQTTLEMLGEKSEMVEELKADVADVKKIYRELVDSTMQ